MAEFLPTSFFIRTNVLVTSDWLTNYRDEVSFDTEILTSIDFGVGLGDTPATYTFSDANANQDRIWTKQYRFQYGNTGYSSGVFSVVDSATVKYVRVNGSGDQANPYYSFPVAVSNINGFLEYLSPSSITTRPGILFPVDKTLTWTLEWKMRARYFNSTNSQSYVGTGGARTIEVGFQPDFVMVATSNASNATMWRTPNMPTNECAWFISIADITDGSGIASFTGTGFTVGNARNAAATTYSWFAFQDTSYYGPGANFTYGSYTGDSTINPRSITGLGFRPGWVVVKRSTGTVSALQRQPEYPANESRDFSASAGVTSTGILSLDTDGFTVGNDVGTNTTGVLYYWFAFRDGGNFVHGSYDGTAAGKDVSTGLAHPGFVSIRPASGSASGHADWRSSNFGTAYDAHYDASAADTNSIISLNTSSFTVGTSNNVNAIGESYYWVAIDGTLGNLKATQTYNATAFRVCGIDNTPTSGGSIVGIDCNQYLGTQIGLPDGTWLETLPTSDMEWHVYSLYWSGSTPTGGHTAYTYYLSRDGVEYGTSLPGGIAGVITRGADFIDIGHTGISTNVPSVFTPIEVQYINITPTAGLHEDFPNGMDHFPDLINDGVYQYGSLDPTNDFALQSRKIIRSGKHSYGIDQDSETGEVVLSLQKLDDATGRDEWAGWNFLGHEFAIEVDFHDPIYGWGAADFHTPEGPPINYGWDEPFYGIVEEADYTVENDELLVSLRGRSYVFNALSKIIVNQSFTTYLGYGANVDSSTKIIDPSLAYFTTNPQVYSYQGVITYINTIGQSIHQFSPTGLTEYSTNATFRINEVNFINQNALSVINEIAEDLASIVNPFNGRIRPYTTWEKYTGVRFRSNEQLSVYKEIILVNYVNSQPVSQVELTFNDTFGNSYVAVYPVNPWPNNGVILKKQAQAIYGANDIANNNPLHVFHWQKENRHVSEIEVTCVYGVDFEYNIDTTTLQPGDFCTVEDDIFLQIPPTVVWVINAREINWDGNQATIKFTLGRTTSDKIDWIRKNL